MSSPTLGVISLLIFLVIFIWVQCISFYCLFARAYWPTNPSTFPCACLPSEYLQWWSICPNLWPIFFFPLSGWLLNVLSCLCILDTSLLFDIRLTNTFSQFVAYLCIFHKAKVRKFNDVQFIDFSFSWSMFLTPFLRNLWLTQGHKDFFFVFF